MTLPTVIRRALTRYRTTGDARDAVAVASLLADFEELDGLLSKAVDDANDLPEGASPLPAGYVDPRPFNDTEPERIATMYMKPPKLVEAAIRRFAARPDEMNARHLIKQVQADVDCVALTPLVRGSIVGVDIGPAASCLVPIANSLRRELGPALGLGAVTT